MEKYLENPAHDYKTEALETQKQFRALQDKERRATKSLIIDFFMDSRYIEDLDVLYEFFF